MFIIIYATAGPSSTGPSSTISEHNLTEEIAITGRDTNWITAEESIPKLLTVHCSDERKWTY
jgi:hypothetical protein